MEHLNINIRQMLLQKLGFSYSQGAGHTLSDLGTQNIRSEEGNF